MRGQSTQLACVSSIADAGSMWRRGVGAHLRDQWHTGLAGPVNWLAGPGDGPSPRVMNSKCVCVYNQCQ
jgi:hypothetical protein